MDNWLEYTIKKEIPIGKMDYAFGSCYLPNDLDLIESSKKMEKLQIGMFKGFKYLQDNAEKYLDSSTPLGRRGIKQLKSCDFNEDFDFEYLEESRIIPAILTKNELKKGIVTRRYLEENLYFLGKELRFNIFVKDRIFNEDYVLVERLSLG